jgi:hypothetical protein
MHKLTVVCAVIFNCFDFQKLGKMSVAEVSAAIEFVVSGLCKAIGTTRPSLQEVDKYVAKVSSSSSSSCSSCSPPVAMLVFTGFLSLPDCLIFL